MTTASYNGPRLFIRKWDWSPNNKDKQVIYCDKFLKPETSIVENPVFFVFFVD